MKNSNKITISELDKERLQKLFNAQQNLSAFRENVQLIQKKLESVKPVTPEKVSPTVVTMNSKVTVKNLSLGKSLSVELVYPDAVDANSFKISVFSPLGASMFGYSQGDEFIWAGRNGKNRFLVEKIIYQPESAGDYHL